MGGGSCGLSPSHQGKTWNPGLQLSKQIHYLGNMQNPMAVNKNLACIKVAQSTPNKSDSSGGTASL